MENLRDGMDFIPASLRELASRFFPQPLVPQKLSNVINLCANISANMLKL
jgi:hypothetical protein